MASSSIRSIPLIKTLSKHLAYKKNNIQIGKHQSSLIMENQMEKKMKKKLKVMPLIKTILRNFTRTIMFKVRNKK